MTIVTQVKCRKCGEMKGVECYTPSRLKYNSKQCRVCERKYKKEYRKRPHVKAKLRKYRIAYERRIQAAGKIDKAKINARNTARKKLPKARNFKCKHCNKQAQEYHHINGYEKEHYLDVIPLCKKCHSVEHGRRKP